ncbi:MAG TPA: TolC family protein, partial [Chitinophagales bacterium]|nr:TolC family protein [Chitinophagales bacterium]
MKFLFRYSLLLVLFAGTQLSAIAQNAVEEWDWSKCLQHTIDNNLQLKQAEINIQLGEATLKQQKLNYSPSVNASTNYNLRVGNNFNFFTSAYTQELVHFQDYGLNVSQPVFDGLIIANNIKKSKLDVEALQFDQQTLQNNIVLQMLAAFLNIMNAKEQEQQALQQQQITREQYERIKTMIEAGAAAEQATLDIEAQLASEELTLAQINNQL